MIFVSEICGYLFSSSPGFAGSQTISSSGSVLVRSISIRIAAKEASWFTMPPTSSGLFR